MWRQAAVEHSFHYISVVKDLFGCSVFGVCRRFQQFCDGFFINLQCSYAITATICNAMAPNC
jgi:hypothetical protein